MSAARLAYSALYYALLPVVVLRLLWRSRRDRDYRRRIAERFGFVAPQLAGAPVIWLHAVSVGETIAAVPLIEALLVRYPKHRLLVTSMTPTGSAQVRQRFGERVAHCYAPYDTPTAVARFLRRTRPQLYLIMETELWPNSVAACRRRGIPALLLNGRLSAKSARGYQRFGRLSAELMANLSSISAQTESDAQRFIALGLAPAACTVSGNIKFDLHLLPTQRQAAERQRRLWGSQRQVWLAASTHPGEEAQLLEAFALLRQRYPQLLLVLVPRHPDRAAAVAAQVADSGWQLARHRDQSARPLSASVDVVVGDTIGELLVFYGAADIAFVGGSLIERGGHNPIEPAVWGCPVVAGASQYNFSEASQLLVAAGAMQLVAGSQELAERVADWLADSAARAAAGSAGERIAEQNGGALERQLAGIAAQLD
ncbi:MAG: lipid IV(A) 3-deoxy-D-manno-octulosonic acid transferase [Porticoccaceae bacterium]